MGGGSGRELVAVVVDAYAIDSHGLTDSGVDFDDGRRVSGA